MTRDIARTEALSTATLKGASAVSKTIGATAVNSGYRAAPAPKHAAMTSAFPGTAGSGGRRARKPRHRLVRSDRGPGQAQAAAGTVPPGGGRPDAGQVPDHRLLPREPDRRTVPRPCPPGDRQLRDQQAHRSGLARIPADALVRQRGTRRRCTVDCGHRAGRAGDRRLARAALPSRHPAGGLRVNRDHARNRRPRPRVPRHHREAIRHRPGLRPRAEQHRACDLQRVTGLSDRPLPRQGVGRQHLGLPVRERPVRAGLEPPAHRLHADRRARDGCDRGTRRFYDHTGAYRDMIVTHLFQVLGFLAMERDRERAQRRQVIVNAARELAEAEGWESVTTRRLAERIEYSQPVLYSHFEGKDGIVSAVALEGFGELAATLHNAREGADSPHSEPRAVASAYMEFARANPALYEAMFTLRVDLTFAQSARQLRCTRALPSYVKRWRR